MDSDDCRICDKAGAALRSMLRLSAPAKRIPAMSDASSRGDDKFSSENSDQSRGSVKIPCPPDNSELGSSTWTFLHTTASYYPDRPTYSEQYNMEHLLRSVALFYPCRSCGDHFSDYIRENPPRVASRSELERWLCVAHNEVNERTGKEQFDCSRSRERWKDGCP